MELENILSESIKKSWIIKNVLSQKNNVGAIPPPYFKLQDRFVIEQHHGSGTKTGTWTKGTE